MSSKNQHHQQQTPEQQAASNVFDSLTAQQQHDLLAYAESLLVDSAEWNSRIRQETLRQMSGDSDNNDNNLPNKDVEKLTASLMPFAMSRMPDQVRQAIIVKLRQMLLAPQ
jgi:hypothetical protein